MLKSILKYGALGLTVCGLAGAGLHRGVLVVAGIWSFSHSDAALTAAGGLLAGMLAGALREAARPKSSGARRTVRA